MRNAGRLLLPIGTTNYKKICDNYYYVDKTLMITWMKERKFLSSLVRDALARP